MRLADFVDPACKILSSDSDLEEIRDVCDQVSGGELDTVQMDILSDMVIKKIKVSSS